MDELEREIQRRMAWRRKKMEKKTSFGMIQRSDYPSDGIVMVTYLNLEKKKEQDETKKP